MQSFKISYLYLTDKNIFLGQMPSKGLVVNKTKTFEKSYGGSKSVKIQYIYSNNLQPCSLLNQDGIRNMERSSPTSHNKKELTNLSWHV